MAILCWVQNNLRFLLRSCPMSRHIIRARRDICRLDFDFGINFFMVFSSLTPIYAHDTLCFILKFYEMTATFFYDFIFMVQGVLYLNNLIS